MPTAEFSPFWDLEMLIGTSNTYQGSKDFSFKIHLNSLLSVLVPLFLLCFSPLPVSSHGHILSPVSPYLPGLLTGICVRAEFPKNLLGVL